MRSTMDRGLTIFILLSLSVTAQTATPTVLVYNLYTTVSVPESQLETTQIVKHPVSLTSNLQVAITAQKNVTRCTELSISPCPDPVLLVAVSIGTNSDKTYSYSKSVTAGLTLTTNFGITVTFNAQDLSAPAGQASVNLIYNYGNSLGPLKAGGNSSVVTVVFTTSTSVILPATTKPGNGQPALYQRGPFGIIALMLLPAFLLI